MGEVTREKFVASVMRVLFNDDFQERCLMHVSMVQVRHVLGNQRKLLELIEDLRSVQENNSKNFRQAFEDVKSSLRELRALQVPAPLDFRQEFDDIKALLNQRRVPRVS